MNSDSRCKTPSRTGLSRIEVLASSSTNIYFGEQPGRDSTTTLVGDLSPPRSSKAKSPQPISSQRATPYRETPISKSYLVAPTISAKKPVCKTCGTPRKGHKRGTCGRSSPPPDECNPLYASSPERERTPSVASGLVESWATFKTPTQSTSAISSAITAVSASGKRRPIHRACNLPMKGHKRLNGVLVCPSDHSQDISLVSSLSIKVQTGRDHQKTGYVDTPSDRRPPKDHLVHHSRSVNCNRDQNTTTLIPAYASCLTPNSQIKHVMHVSPTGDRSRSGSPNPFVSSDSSYSSISTFAPSIASDSQNIPSMIALNDALVEPALAIYPAWSRDEVSQIRQQAHALHFFSGVVNVKIEEKDGFDLTRAIKKSNGDDNYGVSSSHYMKWVIVSRKKEMVQKCICLCGERPLEL